jgi:hypothetical protein
LSSTATPCTVGRVVDRGTAGDQQEHDGRALSSHASKPIRSLSHSSSFSYHATGVLPGGTTSGIA